MTLLQFFDTYLARPVDFDHQLGIQCMDLIEQYNKDVVNAPRLGGNAVDLLRNPEPEFYTFHDNPPPYVPPVGAIAIWKTTPANPYGHCDIILFATMMHFYGIDENWASCKVVTPILHDYTQIAGFLIPKHPVLPPNLAIK